MKQNIPLSNLQRTNSINPTLSTQTNAPQDAEEITKTYGVNQFLDSFSFDQNKIQKKKQEMMKVSDVTGIESKGDVFIKSQQRRKGIIFADTKVLQSKKNSHQGQLSKKRTILNENFQDNSEFILRISDPFRVHWDLMVMIFAI